MCSISGRNFESFTMLCWSGLCKDVNLTFLYEKVTNHYFLVQKSDKLLLFRIEKLPIVIFRIYDKLLLFSYKSLLFPVK